MFDEELSAPSVVAFYVFGGSAEALREGDGVVLTEGGIGFDFDVLACPLDAGETVNVAQLWVVANVYITLNRFDIYESAEVSESGVLINVEVSVDGFDSLKALEGA